MYFTTSDGGDTYVQDADFLTSCLIYTCLTNQNKCISFNATDGRYYRNELCLDEGTLASWKLCKITLDDEERALIDLWKKILLGARTTNNYDCNLSYGIYQIDKELNTFRVEGKGKNKHKVYDYPELNGDLDTLRGNIKEYYKSHIREKMFRYKLIR